MTDLIVYELLQGVRTSRQAFEILRDLQEFEIFPGSGLELTVRASANYRQLRDLGITIRKPIDCLIATFCIEQKHTLLHRDRDFDAFEQHLGLRVLHP